MRLSSSYTSNQVTSGALGIFVGVVLAWLVINVAALPSRTGSLAVWIGGTAVLLLFMLHKLPHAVVSTGSRQLEPVLAAIGFSYVALRLVDVIRAVQEGRHRPPDLASTLNYLLPFHMLAAGPIQSYDQFVAQPGVPPPLTIARSFNAIERVTSGLFKKFVLANYLDRLFLTGFHAPGPYFWLEVQLNFIWLYLDFMRTVMWRSAWELSLGSIHRRTSESPTWLEMSSSSGSAGIFRSPNSSADTCLFQLS